MTRLNGDGPQRVMISHDEVTERKRLETALGLSESQFKTVMDHVPAAIFLKNLEGRYKLVNHDFTRLYGVTEEGVIGKTDHDFLPRVLADISRANDRRALDAGGPVEAEEIAPREDGSCVLMITKMPLFDVNGNSMAVWGIATDITQRKRADEAQALLAAIVQFSDDAIIGKSLDGIIRSWNGGAERIFGYTSDEAIGQPITLIIPPERLDEERRILERLGRGERLSHFETVRVSKEGRRLDISLMSSPIRDREGQIVGASKVARDITERKRSEREILILNSKLEARLERIRSLRQIDLAIASSQDLKLTLSVVLDQVLAHLKVDVAGILLCNLELPTLEYAARKGYPGSDTGRSSQRIDEGPAGHAVVEKRTQHLPGSPGTLPDFYRAEGLVAYWAVPLVVKGQVRGVLEVGHHAPMELGPESLEYLEVLAGQAAIAIEDAEMFEGLRRMNLELSLAYDATIEGLSRALDLRDHETEGHSRRVTEMTLRLARAIGLSGAELVQIRRGALLHDIGKIGIPDAILLKQGPLTEQEWAIMSRHPQHAYELLAPIAFLRPALDIPHYHHEKWDGTGYPCGLEGEQIPLAARVFSAADIWDALRSDRPYRNGWPDERVHAHIQSLASTHLDPKVVESFLRVTSTNAENSADHRSPDIGR